MGLRHLVSLLDGDRADMDRILDRSTTIKAEYAENGQSARLKGKTLAMIFHKPSLRTRVSFEAGMRQLGGGAMFITDREIGMNTREAVEDIARVMSGYVDAIMIRTFDNGFVERLAEHASVPVVNGLTDLYHPCQILADLLTAREHGKNLDEMVVSFVGDGNNVAHSWINGAVHYAYEIRVVHPEGFAPNPDVVSAATSRGANVVLTTDVAAGVEGSDVIYTDVWTSMGQEDEKEERLMRFQGFQVNADLMKRAKGDALFMHCLPAHRGEEVSADVIDGPQSVVFPEAHNRMHAQKGLLDVLVNG